MIFTPRDYQRMILAFGRDHPRFNCWGGTGIGKTATGLELFSEFKMFGEVEHALVISTKRVAGKVWPRQINRWESFHHLSCSVALGTPDQRVEAIRKRADITTINVENIPWLMQKMGEDEWFFDMVFADESSKLKSLRIDFRKSSLGKEFLRNGGGSKRAGKLARVAHKKVNRWVNLTGTPMANGLTDLWGQNWFIDAGARLGRTYSDFENRWFNWIRTGTDAWEAILTPTSWAEAEIKQRLRDVTITIDAKDYMDLPPTIYNKILVTLPKAAYDKYREMEKEMFTTVVDYEIEAVNSGAKSMKCRQLASGAAYIDDAGNWVTVHDEKLDALEDIVAELQGAPLIVAYQFKSDLARLKKRFPKAVYFDDSDATLDAFCAGKIQMLLLHPASAAHGIDEMQNHCRDICFFSMTWNLEEYIQTIERVGATRQVQAGFYRDVRVHLLIGENTIEEDMVERTESKASVQDAFKEAMKKRGYTSGSQNVFQSSDGGQIRGNDSLYEFS